MSGWEFFSVLLKRLFQYLHRFNSSLYDFLSYSDNWFDIATQVITFITIGLWIQITYFTDFVDQINNSTLDFQKDSFDEFEKLASDLANFQEYQSFLIYMTGSKLLTFFLMPKRTYMLIEMLIMGGTYIIFFMVLYFLVNF